MENIICELNGIKYLLVKYPVFKSNRKRSEELIRKYECILQGVDSIKIGGLFSSTYMILNILVPERNVIAFNLDDSSE
jgi:hypothetical protein